MIFSISAVFNLTSLNYLTFLILQVLGTEAGGTLEIVEHNITGLLHPVGRPGTKVLAKNLLYLLNNPSEREKMGMRGKSKVERMYLKTQMYEKFAFVLFKCMRLK